MMQPNPNPLDYRSSHTLTRRPVISLPALITTGVMVTLVAADLFVVHLLVIALQLETMFKDFGMKLPALTVLMFTASRWFVRGGWLILIPVPFVIGFIAARFTPTRVAVDSARNRDRMLFKVSLLLLLTALAISVILIVTLLALFLPMITLIEAVSGN